MADEGAGGGKFAVFMKWIGVAAALLSFGSAVYGLMHTAAELKERGRTVAQQLAAGRSEQSAGDYPAAWASLQAAAAAAQSDGVFANLLGGLGKERLQVRAAQEDLAMQWLRDAHAPEGHTFSEIADKVSETLTAGADAAQGARKADLLAHVGWAYFLKQRDGNTTVRPESLYQQGVAADADNPFAHAFWGHNILWNNGSMAQADQHFSAALSTHRETATVRQWELMAFGNSQSAEYAAQWWRVVDEMHKAGEPLGPDAWLGMKSRYQSMEGRDSELAPLFVVVPAADQVELVRAFLASGTLQAGSVDDGARYSAQLVLAESLEAAGRREESLTAWRDIQSATHGNPNYVFAARVNAAIKRLAAVPGSAGSPPANR